MVSYSRPCGEGAIRQEHEPAAPRPDAGAAVLAIEPFPGLDALQSWWTTLASRADTSFFLTWHWIGAMLAESAIAPLVATARADGVLVGIGLLQPALRHRQRGLVRSRTLFLNETGDATSDGVLIEYNGFLVDRAFGPALERRLLQFLAGGDPARIGLPEWDELRLGGVPERYREYAAGTGLNTRLVRSSGTARIDLDAIRASGNPYLDALSANTRQQIRRAARGYTAQGELAIDAAATLDQACAFLDALAELHQAYWAKRGRPGAFANPFMAGMHRRVIASALPRGEVELLRVRAGDRAIGYLYNFVYRGWVGAYCSGFDYPDDAKLKPGYVSYMLCVERHLAAGNHVFDFLAGDNRYKTSLGRAGETLFDLDVQRPRLALKLETALRGLRDRLGGRVHEN